MKLNTKGMTIIELLLGTVLFSFVALGVTIFLSTGTKTCNNAETTIKVQEESQVVTNQLVNFTIEGNDTKIKNDTVTGDVYFYIYKTNKLTSETTEEKIVYFKKSSNKLYYYEITAPCSEDDKNTILNAMAGGTSDNDEKYLMGEYVEDFKVEYDSNRTTITFDIEFNLSGHPITTHDSVTIRNKRVEALNPII